MKYGYARVSSAGQNLSAQVKQLQEAGCDNIYKEKVSGRKKEHREQFNLLLEIVQEGDVIVVTKLDRFARSTKDALNTIEYLNGKGVSLIVLNMGGDKVDTSTAIGKLMITVLSGIAEFEADMIKERQLEGIEEAKQRGVYKGRPKKYTENNRGLQYALKLFHSRATNKMTVKEIEEITKISRATLYRAVREQGNSYIR
ncbi:MULTISPECIES: recombinase family protein [Bacillus cereus group]|uniref:recombinase family protein n=1 Tax=Bacillus cereus group TaxID=86661 RepID=UPI001F176102|nr:recombinase family protein [Bacillus cereus]MDA1521038.1 recombinase family protein [Bacillus cereus]BCC09474.1 integrase [Bacillus cereus]BCC16695.1 integrase [Bacillus cereus]BCD08888.1 integrase [Bacillus cereus]HDR7980082.1 recombinase family protein [Bacillus cereus]